MFVIFIYSFHHGMKRFHSLLTRWLLQTVH